MIIKQLTAILLTFVFCVGSFAAEDPLAYIPDAKGYVGVNLDKAKASPVLMEAFNPVIADFPSKDQVPDSLQRIYYSDLQSLMKPDKATGFFTLVGSPGMVDAFLAVYRKTETATPSTVNAGALGARPAFDIGGELFMYPVGDSGIVVAQKSNLPALITAAAAGWPAAANGGFQFVHGALDSHAIAAATTVDELMAQLVPTLMRVPGMPANLDKATSSVIMASMWIDLVDNLQAEVNLHVADPQHGKVIADALNHFFALMRQGLETSRQDPDMLQVLQGIKCGTSLYGATVKVHVPQSVVTRLGARIKGAIPAVTKGTGTAARQATPTPVVTGLTPTPVPTKILPRR